MTDEYCVRETELTSQLDGHLTGEMTTAGRLISQIQEVVSSNRVVSTRLGASRVLTMRNWRGK